MMPARHGLSLSLILALFCAQLLFAWHAPAHIDAQPHDSHDVFGSGAPPRFLSGPVAEVFRFKR